MKRITALFFALLLSLAACGGGTANSSGETEKSSPPAESPVPDSASNNTDADVPEQDETKTEDEEEKEISFDEIVVIDNEECKITITGIKYDDILEFTIKTLLEGR